MGIVIGSAARAIGSDRKQTQSAILFRVCLLRGVFMTASVWIRQPSGEQKVMRRTGVLRGGPGRCGLVLGDLRKAACTDSAKGGVVRGRSAKRKLRPTKIPGFGFIPLVNVRPIDR